MRGRGAIHHLTVKTLSTDHGIVCEMFILVAFVRALNRWKHNRNVYGGTRNL